MGLNRSAVISGCCGGFPQMWHEADQYFVIKPTGPTRYRFWWGFIVCIHQKFSFQTRDLQVTTVITVIHIYKHWQNPWVWKNPPSRSLTSSHLSPVTCTWCRCCPSTAGTLHYPLRGNSSASRQNTAFLCHHGAPPRLWGRNDLRKRLKPWIWKVYLASACIDTINSGWFFGHAQKKTLENPWES